MKFPSLLYEPTVKGLTALVPFRVQILSALSVAAADIIRDSHSSAVGIDLESVIVVTGFHAEAIAGGAQTVNTLEVTVNSADAPTQILADVDRNGSAVAPLGTNNSKISRTDCEFLLMPREFLRAHAVFNAGVASNQVRLSLFGYAFNRGNVQFGG